jgi:hypothetical protein
MKDIMHFLGLLRRVLFGGGEGEGRPFAEFKGGRRIPWLRI